MFLALLSLRNWFSGTARAARRGRGSTHRPRLEALEDRTLLSPGDLDPTFGDGGLVTTNPSPGTRGGGAAAVAVLSDGRLVVAGSADMGSSTGSFAVARYNSDGTLDPSFGSGGLVTTPFPGYPFAGASRVVVQPDGRIVAAGDVESSSGKTISQGYALARYNSDGSLDTSFGIGGRITISPHLSRGGAGASGLAVQPDGRILVAGSTTPGYASEVALVRLEPDGSLDSSFGSNGIVTTSFPGYQAMRANGVTLQFDGRIVVTGLVAPPGSARFAVVRYNSDGSLDTSFGTGGLATASFGGSNEAGREVAVLPDGHIVTVGYTFNTISQFALARFGSDGRLDGSFGTGGQVTTSFPGYQYAEGYALAVQPNGRILVTGVAFSLGGAYRFGLARYNSDGTLDSSFGTAGLVTTDFGGSYAEGRSVVLQSDGRLVVAGTSSDSSGLISSFSLARYLGDALTATHFAVSVPAEVTAGQPFDVTVTAVDDNGNVVPDYAGTVTLTSTDPLAPTLGSHTFTTADGGVYTFSSVQLFTAGPQSLFADDGNLNGQADLTVDPGTAVAIVLSGPDHAAAGVPIVVTVTAVDAWGNVATGYTGNAWLEATDPDANLPDAWDFTADDAGTHQFAVTLNTPGPVRLTAHDTDAGWDADLDLTVT
jgi:uncharacterized delta-60 repeat protein